MWRFNRRRTYLSLGKMSPLIRDDDSQIWESKKKHKTGIKSTDAVVDRIIVGTSGWSIRLVRPTDETAIRSDVPNGLDYCYMGSHHHNSTVYSRLSFVRVVCPLPIG